MFKGLRREDLYSNNPASRPGWLRDYWSGDKNANRQRNRWKNSTNANYIKFPGDCDV